MVGGLGDVVGSDRAAVDALVREDRRRTLPGPDAVWFEMQEDGPYLRVGVGEFDGIADVWLIVYGPEVSVEIARGENAGRTITYGNVVREIRRLGTWSGAAADFAVPDFADSDRVGRVALIQMAGHGAILGTARFGRARQ